MRILLAAAACAAIFCLAGCGEADDNQMRATFRDHHVQTCIVGMRAAAGVARLHLDGPRLCACAMDRYVAGKSAAELRSADPHDPALRAAVRQCGAEQMRETAAEPLLDENGAVPAD